MSKNLIAILESKTATSKKIIIVITFLLYLLGMLVPWEGCLTARIINLCCSFSNKANAPAPKTNMRDTRDENGLRDFSSGNVQSISGLIQNPEDAKFPRILKL